MKTFDITQDKEALDILNAILSNHGIAELKIEKDKIIVIEIKRSVRTSKPQDR